MNDIGSQLSEHRDDFVAYLRRQLVGPAVAEDETLVDPLTGATSWAPCIRVVLP